MKDIIIVTLMIIAVAICSIGLVAYAKEDAKTAVRREVKPQAESEVKLPDIPGITSSDKTPNACVNCHVNHPERNMDYRLLSILAQWKNSVDPEIFEKAKAAAPEGRTLTGKHPDVSSMIKIIPDDCLKCHARNSQMAPPFAKLLHAIHLVGGKENHFLATYQGTCTNCHKLDQKTGTWHIGSGEAN